MHESGVLFCNSAMVFKHRPHVINYYVSEHQDQPTSPVSDS